jgi:pimeloyl-ACP methyl ester carboxylesterase
MGLGGNIEMWEPFEHCLDGDRFQTISFDASGTGESPAGLVPMRIAGFAQQAAGVLDALGHQQADVLGVSFGGAVAQELAIRQPERVRRLVLVSTSCGIGGIPGSPVALALLATPLRYWSPTFHRLTARLAYGGSAASDDGLLHTLGTARRSKPPSLWGYFSQLTAAAGWSSAPSLHRITQPTLVVSGGSDPIVPARNARLLARRIPAAELEIMPGHGHLLLLEDGPAVATRVTQFLGCPGADLAVALTEQDN